MQKLSRSVGRFAWAMSAMSVQQALNVAQSVGCNLGKGSVSDTFDAITSATERQFGESAHRTFELVDGVQGQMIDFGFSIMPLGTLGPQQAESQAGNPIRRIVDALPNCGFWGLGENTPTGWGPMPPVPSSSTR